MENGVFTSGDMVRIIGVAAVGIGIAWALQALGLAGDGSALSRLMWVVSAASICSVGAGLVITAGKFQEMEAASYEA